MVVLTLIPLSVSRTSVCPNCDEWVGVCWYFLLHHWSAYWI